MEPGGSGYHRRFGSAKILGTHHILEPCFREKSQPPPPLPRTPPLPPPPLHLSNVAPAMSAPGVRGAGVVKPAAQRLKVEGWWRPWQCERTPPWNRKFSA